MRKEIRPCWVAPHHCHFTQHQPRLPWLRPRGQICLHGAAPLHRATIPGPPGIYDPGNPNAGHQWQPATIYQSAGLQWTGEHRPVEASIAMAWAWWGAARERTRKKRVELNARIHLSRSWAVEKYFVCCKGPPLNRGVIINRCYFTWKTQLFSIHLAGNRAKKAEEIWVCMISMAETCDLRQVPPPPFRAQVSSLMAQENRVWTESDNAECPQQTKATTKVAFSFSLVKTLGTFFLT